MIILLKSSNSVARSKIAKKYYLVGVETFCKGGRHQALFTNPRKLSISSYHELNYY